MVIDPMVGDVGIAVFADRDISSVKANGGAQSNPGSMRRHNLADGVYLGGVLFGTPQQWVQVTSDGITLHDRSGNVVTTSSAGVEITTALLKVNGPIQATGEVTAGYGGADAVGLQTHTHGGGPPPDPGS